MSRARGCGRFARKVRRLPRHFHSRRRRLWGPVDEESAWPLVESWIAEAKNDARVLAGDRRRGEEALRLLQVTPRSALGAIAIETGGLLVDHGWVRVLGGDGLVRWNALGGADAVEPLEDALVVAYDAIGGFYALNGGAFPREPGSVFFLAPDTLGGEDFEMGHSVFVRWLCDADLDGFYDELGWPGWEREVPDGSLELGFPLYPP